jgi:hypothetical protein
MTRKEICALIQIRLAGGMPSDDFAVTLNEINLWLDHAIAASAMKNYADGVQIDGIEFVGDAYYTTFKDLVLSQDSISLYYKTTIPAPPVSVPRGYDISSAYIQKGVGIGGFNKPMIRVTPQALDFYNDLPKPKNSVEYWTEGMTMYVTTTTSTLLNGAKVAVRMIGSAGSRLLTDEALVPNDAIPFIVDYVFKYFMPTDSAPKDTMNDGTNNK